MKFDKSSRISLVSTLGKTGKVLLFGLVIPYTEKRRSSARFLRSSTALRYVHCYQSVQIIMKSQNFAYGMLHSHHNEAPRSHPQEELKPFIDISATKHSKDDIRNETVRSHPLYHFVLSSSSPSVPAVCTFLTLRMLQRSGKIGERLKKDVNHS